VKWVKVTAKAGGERSGGEPQVNSALKNKNLLKNNSG
jgi:hypothetical protein